MSRQTVFNSSWLSDKTFSMWLGKHPDSTKKARCLIWSKAIELGNMGKQALKSHADGAKHKLKIQLMQKTKMGQPSLPSLWGTTSTYREPGSQHQDPHIDKLVVPPPPQPEPGPSGTPSGATATTGSAHVQIQQNINSFVARDSVLTAEILWALKSVIDHYSASSSSNVSALFQRIFYRIQQLPTNLHVGKLSVHILSNLALLPTFILRWWIYRLILNVYSAYHLMNPSKKLCSRSRWIS